MDHELLDPDCSMSKCDVMELIDSENGACMPDEVQGMKIEVRPCGNFSMLGCDVIEYRA